MSTSYREIDSHIAVKVDRLEVGARLPIDIFIMDAGVLKPLFNKGMIFSRIAQSIIHEKGVSEIYVPVEQRSALATLGSVSSRRGEGSFLEDPVAFKNYSYTKDKYFQIERNVLVPGTKVSFSIYSLERLNFRLIAEASDAAPITVDNRIINASGDLCILSIDVPKYNEYLQMLSDGKNLPAEKVSSVKALIIKENAKVIMKELLDDPRSGQSIKKTEVVVTTMIDSILENRETIYDLVSLKQYDYYTYTHSVNVAVLAIGLAVAIKLDRMQVELLGMGALLHDIGKSAIPAEILNKQGKLSDSEYLIIKSHVVEGEKILRANPDISDKALPAALQHHEKLSGRGYPLGLKGSEISLFGRISAIADCYDALTTRRPYKAPMTPFYALSIIAKETGDFDPELLKIFIKMLGKIQ